MKVAIIKYNAGNVQSVIHALSRLGVEVILSDNAEVLQTADKIIFPGVGEASSCMNYLNERNLVNIILSLKQPVLGICLGLQLLANLSEENITTCIGIFDKNVRKLPDTSVKVPHMGWNQIFNLKGPLFKGVEEGSYVYFVHSYFIEVFNDTIATTKHGTEFSASVQSNNFYGVQFHPEKSAEVGEIILRNFLSL
jgi:glutamine amidotransferase